MVRKGNLAVFEGNGIFETRETTPTKISVHACHINQSADSTFDPYGLV